MIHDPVIAGALIGIALVIYFAVHLLRIEETEKRNAHEQAEREAARDRYLRWVRSKYAGDQPHGYRARRHVDFTGETPLSPSQLAEVKQEIVKS